MDDCPHDAWVGGTTYFATWKRCTTCGAVFEREALANPPHGARLPWAPKGEEDPHGRDQGS